MERMWNESTNLDVMQQQIGDIFQERLGQGVLIGNILNLDREDYRLLYDKAVRISDPGLFQKYPLALITAWALSYRYGMNESILRELKKNMGTMPQHHTRLVIDMFVSAFYDYGIDTFGINFRSLGDIKKVIENHHE